MSPSSQLEQRFTYSRWLPYCRWQAEPKLRLLCFAHAGGSATQFRGWERRLPNTVEVCAVQLPGRETRLHEKFIKRIPPLIDELVNVLSPLIDRPVAILGHSLGARVGFEFARKICERTDVGKIVHVFVSGAPAPHIAPTKPPSFNLPEDEFIQVLKDFGGTPPEVLQNPEMLQFVLPRLRADLELNETYVFAGGQALDASISAFGGEADQEATPAAVRAWGEHTTAKFRCRIFAGSHFFLYEKIDQIIPLITQDLIGHL